MDSFMSNIKTAASGVMAGENAGHDDKKSNVDQPLNTNTDLMSNAKLVAEAAHSAANNQTDQIDKPKVAGATTDLLDSAKQYGKFDESQGVGEYLKQAEDYLHQYEKSSGAADSAAPSTYTPPSAAEEKSETPAPVEEKKVEASAPVEEKKEEAPTSIEEKFGGKDESESGVGAGDVLKAAGSFFNK